MSIKELRNKMIAIRKEMASVGRQELEKEFAKFFEECPEVVCIVFKCYTPYFNDGDPCSYRVTDFNLKFTKEAKKALLSEELDEDYDQEDWESDYSDGESLYDVSSARVKEIDSAFDKLVEEIYDSELFEIVLGDHIKVKASKNGIQITDYENHD